MGQIGRALSAGFLRPKSLAMDTPAKTNGSSGCCTA